MARLGLRLSSPEYLLGKGGFQINHAALRRARQPHLTEPPSKRGPAAPSAFNRRRRAQKPGLYEVMVTGPPAESLGIHMLEPNVHNGDCINVDDTDYLVQALSIRFKLMIVISKLLRLGPISGYHIRQVKGRYQRDHSKLEVKSASRFLLERNLESAFKASGTADSDR